MTGTAAARLTDLLHRNGSADGLLRGSVEIDQIYAHYQHERLDLRHPRGGGPKFLERPLMERYPRYLEMIAHDYLGGGARRSMARAMEDLSDAAELASPWEFGDLMHSGHPEVRRGERVTYDRPPKRHRLTAAELRAKTRMRWASLPGGVKGLIARRARGIG